MHITKRLGALAMAVVMTCALAITASAVDTTGSYSAKLTVSSVVPHTLDFFETPVSVTDDGTNSTVVLSVKSPATVTVFGVSVSGEITDIQKNSADTSNYTVTYDNSAKELTVVCPSSVTASTFSVKLDFTIVRSDEVTHNSQTATLTLVNS